jgi:hypothetical protein
MMAKTKAKSRIKTSKKKTYYSESILAEIGLFVVEFEKLQKEVKDIIIHCFEADELHDTNLIQIILYQSTAYDLTEFFRGLTLYKVLKMEIKSISKEDKLRMDLLKGFIKIANSNLGEIGTFRNDLLHATYDNTTDFYFKGKELKFKKLFQGQRSKIRSKGIELHHINIKRNVFKKVIDMMMILRFLINHIDAILNGNTATTSENTFKTLRIEKDFFKVYDEIKIGVERKKLFETREDYYQKQYVRRRDDKARQEYFDVLKEVKYLAEAK